MQQLLPQYQAPGVVDLCPGCAKWVNKLKSDMLDQIGPRMQQAIAERKATKPINHFFNCGGFASERALPPKPKPSWAARPSV
jgi:hypothetical protein